MGTLLSDLRFGLRLLAKTPAFTIVALIALALGIGANTAIFSLVNAVLLRPLPFAEPDRLIWVFGNIRNGGNSASVAPLDFLDYPFDRTPPSNSSPLPSLFRLPVNLTGSGDPERLSAAGVTGNYFQALGVAPALGRTFALENETAGTEAGGRAELRTLAKTLRRRSGNRRKEDHARRARVLK